MWRKLRRFAAMKRQMKLFYMEAFLLLGWARILKAMPFNKVAPKLGIERDETEHSADESMTPILHGVLRSVNAMSKVTPWESMCMVKAMAAMKMLQRRGIESTLYLGTAKGPEGKMIAHAWLRSGPYYITGYEEMHKFTTVNTFAKRLTSSAASSKIREIS